MISKLSDVILANRMSEDVITRFEKEYGEISIKENTDYHDRFLIIDDNNFYHLGASLNYAGKKVFAITKMEDEEIIKAIKGNL